MERADGARNGKAQSEPRAKRVHEPMAPGAVRRTAWVADAGAPVPSVSRGGVPGRMGRHRTRGGQAGRFRRKISVVPETCATLNRE